MKNLDVVGIGNAIVDALCPVEDVFLAEQDLVKGAMTLVDEARSKSIYAAMGPATESSGGSAANTMAALAGLGAKAAFIGKVFDDQLGAIFRHDMRATGVAFDTPATALGKSTANCLILVSPDAQRTMATFIGASSYISPNDIDEAVIRGAKAIYLEGYLWDELETKNALRKASELAKKHGTKVAFSLSDSFCVNRHHAEFVEFIRTHVDWLFANEEEIKALTGAADFDAAKKAASGLAEMVALTRSAAGSVLIRGAEEAVVPAVTYGKVVDTTGAGDLYAAGVLYGLTHGFSLAEAGALGSRLAGTIIAQMGARAKQNLRELLPQQKAA